MTMYAVNPQYNPFGLYEHGVNNAKVLTDLYSVSSGLNNILKFALRVIPVLYQIRKADKKLRKELSKVKAYVKKPFESHEEYKAFRLHYDDLERTLPTLKRIMEIPHQDKFFLDFCADQLKKVAKTLMSLQKLMEKKLDLYNRTNCTIPNVGVHHKSEKELWTSRAAVYDYWM